MIAMGRTIVVVEDSFDCAETLQIALESIAGVDIRVVASGQAALEFLARGGEDVAAIVTDLQMPRMSGMDLLTRLKSDPRLRQIPVLIISGDSDPRLHGEDRAGRAIGLDPQAESDLGKAALVE